MSPIKVAHITAIDLSLKYLLLDQLNSIQQAGFEVTGVSSDGPHVTSIEAAGIRHISVPMRRDFAPLADLVTLWRLYRLMRREKFTIVHTHTPKPGLLGQLAGRMAGVPIVINTVHGFYFHSHMRPAARRFYVTLEKLAATCSDVILSQNEEDIQTALRERICSPTLIKHLGNGIDLTQFDPSRFPPDDVMKSRKEIGISSDAPVVGFVGRLAARRKGFLDFLAAAKSLSEQIPEVRFLVVGESDLGKPDAVEPLAAADYGIAERCVFVGQRPNEELPLLYSMMNILVLPSLFEGMPRSLMEATAMGIPVVASDVKGNREVVQVDRNGILVPYGDVQALTKALHNLLIDAKRSRFMSEEGRRVALERFDQRMVFDKVLSEYRRLLQQKRIPIPQPESGLSPAF